MSMVISGDNGLTFPAGSTQVQAGNYQTMVNRIINGRMEIDQRNAGASVTPIASAYTVDRWSALMNVASKFSVQQNAGSVTPPAGFSNYLGVTSTSAYSVAAGEYFGLYQPIEGFNTADLNWGTANAQTVTLSFWVRSSLTGTFGGALANNAQNRNYPFSYTISSANTWEQKSITIAGDTTGTWLTNNSVGVYVIFGLGVGSSFSQAAGSWTASTTFSATGATSVVGTNGATFYITGVDLRVGSYTVVPQDFRAYGTELALCQRYGFGFSTYNLGCALNSSDGYASNLKLPVTMRVTPTLASGASFVVGSGSAGTPTLGTTLGRTTTADCVTFYNSASNWGTNVLVAVTGFLSAEL